MKLDIEHNGKRLEKVPLEDVLELQGQVLVIGTNSRAPLELFVQEKEIQDKVARIQRAKRRERISNFANAAEDSREWFDLPKSMGTQLLTGDDEEQEPNNPFEEDHEQGAFGGAVPKPLPAAAGGPSGTMRKQVSFSPVSFPYQSNYARSEADRVSISRPGDRFSLNPVPKQVQFEFPTAGTTSFEPDLHTAHLSSDLENFYDTPWSPVGQANNGTNPFDNEP